MLVLSLLSFIGCMPKIWQNQCKKNNDCKMFSIVSEELLSDTPFEISRSDTLQEVRVQDFQLSKQAMLIYAEGRELCRGYHVQNTTYQVSSDKKRHRRYQDYQFTKEDLVKGDYQPCDDWLAVDKKTELFVEFQNGTETVEIPLQHNTKNEYSLPFAVMGWGMLANPKSNSLQYVAKNNEQSNQFQALLPERNYSWICDAMQSFQEIAAIDKDFNSWELIFETSSGVITIPYVYDNNPRLSFFKEAIQQCDPNIQSHIQTALTNSAKKYSAGESHISYQYRDLFDKNMRRTKKYSTKTSSSKSSKSSKNAKLSGTYRCSASGQVAYLRIARNGAFNLKVELQNGSASGVCQGNSCEIDNIYKSAISFTGGIERFKFVQRGNALIINDSTRCEKK